LIFLNSCSPIIKTHGYKVENPKLLVDFIENQNSDLTTKKDILNDFGTPSIKIDDIDDTWIYLVSTTEKNVFKKDEVNFQFILSFKFDEENNLIKNELVDKSNINQISFSRDKTKVPSSNYNLADQIVDSFTRGR
jgi:outer membrane protein assembly factor BamE (lipoprotein component of BamABCDE complex)